MDSPEFIAALAVSFSLRLLVVYLGLVVACLLFRVPLAEGRLVPIALLTTVAGSIPRLLGIAFDLALDRWMVYASLTLAFAVLLPLLLRWSRMPLAIALRVATMTAAFLALYSLALLSGI